MRIAIRHEFRFACDENTAHAVQHVLMTPIDTPNQKVVEWTIKMPGIEHAARFTDAFGNKALLVSQTRPEEDLFISVTGVVETSDTHGVVGRIAGDSNFALFKRFTPQTRPNGTLVNRLKAQAKAGASSVDLLHWLMNRLHEARDGSQDDGEDTPEIVAEDHAHVFVAAARGIDIPARFVTGYVLDGDTGPARLHAWAEAWDEKLGWIGFDPSANLCPTEAYVRIAVGLDADTTQPVRLVPNLPREADDVIRVTQAMMSQQQQAGSQSQSGA
ncbi:transglutaminase family protein [Pelagibacterium luteolum]|uniref:Transglutaminase-like enzyme, putative cysteine protease n=1 Tax=Pelagibacterium luteolum TaxID=440168 RepID=A0A1G7U2P9_9HYPH|nr:transglutaminase family protein [Pelagibacterium luteolum]SDG41773.1 Transglutaminase-like enzyme, putative cysteine protease [Pelagibacterium luteolum]